MISVRQQDPVHVVVAAVVDEQDDDARDALAGILPDELMEMATVYERCAELARCAARGRR